MADVLPGFGGFREVFSGSALGPVTANSGFGAWKEIVASTPADSDVISVSPASAQSLHAAVQIGIGPVGGEVVVVPGLPLVSWSSEWQPGSWITLPASIRAGSRVAVRGASTSTAPQVGAFVRLYASSGPSHLQNGVAFSVGLNQTFGFGTRTGANNVWTELSAALPRPMRYGYLMLQSGSNDLEGMAYRLGVGPAGQERVVAGSGDFIHRVGMTNIKPDVMPVYVAIPAGTRVSFMTPNAISANRPYVTLVGVS